MRFGCCLNMVAQGHDGTGVEHLPELAAAGYDYVELPLAELMALSEEGRKEVQKALQRTGVPCETCNNFFPGTIRLTGEEADPDAVMEYVDRALAFAGSLGVKRVVFGSGKAKNLPEGFSRTKGYRQVVELLKRVNVIAAREDITIAIEPLRQAECNLINSFAEGCRLAEDVNGANVKVLVDFYHLTEEKEPVSHIRELGKRYLAHVHFANPRGRVYPTCQETEVYREFAEALKEIGYDQRVSCEAYADSYADSAPGALEVLRQLFA